MTETKDKKTTIRTMTPLWVISLFVSLTEAVTGIAVTQATGGIQIALTTFVIAFPVLVASAFFAILWNRPYVLYPPTEFATGVDVTKYVGAMKSKVEVVEADFQAEIANLRGIVDLESGSNQQRLDEMEKLLSDISKQTQATKQSFKEYKKSIDKELLETQRVRSNFDENSKYRIHVVSVTENPPNKEQDQELALFANLLQKAGYKTSIGGWGSLYFFPKYKNARKSKAIRIIATEANMDIARHLLKFVASNLDIPAEIVSMSDAIPDDKHAESFLPKDNDLTIAYCLS